VYLTAWPLVPVAVSAVAKREEKTMVPGEV